MPHGLCMFRADGSLAILDFGIAKHIDAIDRTGHGEILGTPRYMSPEQARAQTIDGRSDIYSLGIVGYECLTGNPPFDAGDALGTLMKHIQAPLPRPSFESDADRALFAVIERMLAKHPEDRFRDADELIAALGGREVHIATGEHRRWTAPVDIIPSDLNKTAPLPAVHDYPVDHGPQASPALDAAFDASIQMLKRQRPKLRELRATIGGALSGLRPMGATIARALRRATASIQPGARALGDFVGQHGRRMARAARRTLTSRGSTVSMASAFIIAVAVLTFTAFRRTGGAGHSDSRCPTGVAMDGKRPFGVLVDDIGSTPQGSDLNVHFDVCGLAEGTPFKVKMSMVRDGTRHAADRMTANFDDTSVGMGTRRVHSLAVASLPAGSYRLTVIVTDDKGRKRDTDLAVRISGK